MKRIYLVIFTVLLLIACKKDNVENVFGQKPEERISDTLKFIRNELVSAPNGWKGGFSTGAKGGYGFYFNFKNDQTVEMLSDYSTSSGNELKSSTYRVSPLFTPTLIFDTYNYITIMQDPAPDAGGAAGSGFKSDIEFLYNRHNGDTLFFTGKKYRQPFILVKNSSKEQESYLANGLNDFKAKFEAKLKDKYVFSFFDGNQNNKIGLEFDLTGKTINFNYINSNSNLDSVKAKAIYFSTSSIELVAPVKVNEKLIKSLNLSENSIEGIFTDNSKITLKSQSTPPYNFIDVFAYNKAYKRLIYQGAIPGVDANVPIFDRVNELFKASGRTINTMYFTFNNSTTATFYIGYTSGSSSFIASATYSYRREGDKMYMKKVSIDGGNNWNTRTTQVKPVENLFGDGSKETSFTLEWAASSDPAVKYAIGAIKSTVDSKDMLYGKLGN